MKERLEIVTGRISHRLYHYDSEGRRTLLARAAYGDSVAHLAEEMESALEVLGTLRPFLAFMSVPNMPPPEAIFVIGIFVGALLTNIAWVIG